MRHTSTSRPRVGTSDTSAPNSAWCTQQHLTFAPMDRRRLDLVVYRLTPLGGALCCDATPVSPLTRTGLLQPCAGRRAPKAEQRPSTTRVLGSEGSRRWSAGAHQVLRDLVRVRAQLRQPCEAPLRRHGPSIGGPCWPCPCTSTALGSAWPARRHASRQPAPELERRLDLADTARPSCLPLRGP